jgi:glycolate oxidase iron-sulfur subunit
MRALFEGRLSPTDKNLRSPLDRCLDCRACESACPSGVRYGEILEDVRARMLDVRGAYASKTTRFVLDRFISARAGRAFALGLAAFAQRMGIIGVLARLPLPRAMRQGLRLLPRLPQAGERQPIAAGIYEPLGPQCAEVGLFTGCVMETAFGRVNRATLRLLQAFGCRVHVPQESVCCGALHVHAGLRETARPLIDRAGAAFPAGLDAIVVNSAGCGATMKEYGHWHAPAADLAGRVRDLSEVLARLTPARTPRALVRRVAYDDACHLCHGQNVRAQPRQLLAQIPGLSLVDLDRPEDCCGSAGIYNLQQPQMAEQILARKVDDILASSADTVVTGNPGCMMQIAMGLRARGSGVAVVHTAELLAEAYDDA